jgi:hypothetical protein
MKRLFFITLFLLSFLFYWATAQSIENRSEADDAFEYATMVESDDHPWLYHPHHLLYGPSMQTGYRLLQSIGYQGRPFSMMMMVSALSAAGSLFFFFSFCYRRFSLRPVSSLLATALMATSYGFWRYAAEAEIVLPAAFLSLIALYYATAPEPRRTTMVLALLFSVLSVLMHIMNAVVVFVAIPCFYLIRHAWKMALLHVVLSAGVISAVYWGIGMFHPMYSGGSAQFMAIGLGSFVKAAVALTQCIVSADFVLGMESVRAFLGQLFAARMLEEEFYMGARLSRGLVLFSMLTYIAFTLLCVSCLLRAAWIWKNMVTHRDRFQVPKGMATLLVALVWFIGYAGLLLLIEPGNPELWVMGLIPLWLLFCGAVLLPLTVDNRLWLPFAMLLILFIHNGKGGIGVLGDPEKDYQSQKAAWILEHATAGDIIVTAADPVFIRYLRYHHSGAIAYLYDLPLEELEAGRVPDSEGTVYIMGDVFEQIRSLQVRFPERSALIKEYAESIYPDVELVVDNEFGGIYMLQSQADSL